MSGPELRTPEQWSSRYGIEIYDPDGWRGRNDPPWDKPITLEDFYKRALHCTIRNATSVDWQRIAQDAAKPRIYRLRPGDYGFGSHPWRLDVRDLRKSYGWMELFETWQDALDGLRDWQANGEKAEWIRGKYTKEAQR